MHFTFPANKTIQNGVVKNFARQQGRLSYYNINISAPLDNTITIDGVDYFFTYLNGALPGNKGGNSIILKLYEAQSINIDDTLDYDEPDLILKLSKFKKAANPDWMPKSEKRFNREIAALKDCLQKDFQNVIRIFHDGICSIFNTQTGRLEEHLFYTMEYAAFDLKTFIEANHSILTLDEKLSLCISICEGLKELYTLGYYHRDIKPDNIFMVGSDWKIGDLGLINDRKRNNDLDDVAEFIGPRGWLSPEAMNKYLCEGKSFNYKYDCFIDHQSDIFQLGKVFWYIFQHNAPIGEVKESDFFIKNSLLYSILKTMLRYSKKARYNQIEEVIRLMKLIGQQLLRKTAA